MSPLNLSFWLWRWRYRPGLLLAAKLAESAAWSNKNTPMLGPEQNLTRLAESLRSVAGAPPPALIASHQYREG